MATASNHLPAEFGFLLNDDGLVWLPRRFPRSPNHGCAHDDEHRFGRCADFPVAKPLRTKPQARRRIGHSKRMKKRRHSCFIDPGRAAFPSDADLHRRRFPSQRRYARMIPQRQPAGNASGRSVEKAGRPPSARPPCARGMPSEGESGAGSNPRLGCRADSPGRRPESQCRTLTRRLDTASNHPVVKRN